jgi:hypothetical protein
MWRAIMQVTAEMLTVAGIVLPLAIAVLRLLVRIDKKLAVLTQRLRHVESRLDIELTQSAHHELM